jgi:tRNA(adenine34) deaminase
LFVWENRGVSIDPFASSMQRALDEATLALASNDVPVGAVVVDAGGNIVGAAHNRREADRDPTAHAEMLALRQAAATVGSWRLDDCTLVVTLEPCTMCAGAVVLARIGRLVFGAWNEEMGAAGTLWDVVRDRRLTHRPEVISGVRDAECGALLQTFFATQRDSG